MIVTSDGRSTTLEAADSNAAPVLIDGTATPFAAPHAASDDELVELRFEVIGRDGRPGVAHINVYDVDDASVSAYRRLPGDPEAECTAKPSSPAPCILVPPGTYSLMGLVKTMPADQPSDQDQSTIQNLSLVGDPEVEVTEDRTFTFDARRARRVEVQTPGARTSTNDNGAMELGYYRTAANGQTIKVWQRPGSQLDQNFYMEPTATVRTGGLQTLTRLRLEAPAIELDAPRTDDLHPAYYKASWFSDFSSQFPVYDGRDRLRVVDAGHATADDLAGRDLRGALAVVERSEAYSVAEQSNRAAAAGAVLVAVYNDGPGDNADPNGTGRMLEVPTVRLSRAEGRELLDLRRRDRVEVRGEAVTPYVYDMVLKEKGRIRRDPVYVAQRGRNGNLSEQVREFHGQPSIGSTFSEAAYPWQPGDTVASSRTFPLRGGPQTRTEYRLADPDTRWRLAATTPETKYNSLFPHDPVLGMLLTDAQIRTYAAGERVHKPVGAAPVTAGPNPAAPFERTGDRMRVVVSGFLDADGNYGISHTDDSGMSTKLEIRADDELIAATTATPQGTAVLPQGESRVSISFTADNPQSWTELSTHTETEWTFDSVPVPADAGGRAARDRHRLRRRRRPPQPDPRPGLPAGALAPRRLHRPDRRHRRGVVRRRRDLEASEAQGAPGDPAPGRRLRLAAGARPRRRRLGAVPADHPGVVRALTPPASRIPVMWHTGCETYLEPPSRSCKQGRREMCPSSRSCLRAIASTRCNRCRSRTRPSPAIRRKSSAGWCSCTQHRPRQTRAH